MWFQKKIYHPEKIEVKESNLHGRGVFSLQSFSKGETIEKAPAILLNAAEKEHLQTTSLFRYYFLVPNDKTSVALGLGYSSLYNHSIPANAEYSMDIKKRIIIIKAAQPIKEGEEITLNYNGTPNDTSPVYFKT